MNSLSALLLLAASVAAVSASGECSNQSSADAQIAQAKEVNLWAANVVADVVHAGMSKHSKQDADGWAKSYQKSLAPACSGPELRVNQVDKASYSASALGVSPAVCSGLCTAADVACKLACAALPGNLQWGYKPACESKVSLCHKACPEVQTKMELPTISGRVDGPLLQALATVCTTLSKPPPLMAVYTPKDNAENDDKLDQPYEVTPGGVGAAVAFKESLAPYGTVIDSITDWWGGFEATIPPFAALIVQPKDGTKPILIFAWRSTITIVDWIEDLAFAPTLSSRWSSETKEIRAHGAYINLVENTFSMYEDAIVDLVEKHKVERAFITGHSLGGGLANVAHLIVRGQLKKAGSPWFKLDNKVNWLSYSFSAPETIVRLYKPESTPRLMTELDDSSFNFVYGCDPFPRVGILKYLGDFLQIAVPKIAEAKISCSGKPFCHVVKGLLSFSGIVPTITDGVVKFLKSSGTAYVVNQLTHLGTVVYQESENLEYEHIEGTAAIREKLDVGGEAFTQLWPTDPEKYAKAFIDSHLHVFLFQFGSTGIPSL